MKTIFEERLAKLIGLKSGCLNHLLFIRHLKQTNVLGVNVQQAVPVFFRVNR